MSLIASISGVRGTIGGRPAQNLSPLDIVKFAAAYGQWLLKQGCGNRVVLGRDARPSGDMVRALVAGTLTGMGIDVVDAGLATTPTVEMAVVFENAAGGIILTASHNPIEWNALKLLNHLGEFISAEAGAEILELYENQQFEFASVEKLGKITENNTYLDRHIDAILALPLVNAAAIEAADFSVAVDAVNSVGGFAVPALLRRLGVRRVTELNCTPNGLFPHNPEPLREHLGEICGYIAQNGADVGIVVDPDVDRLALIDEKGEMFGEEYTLVAIADYVLRHKKGATVSNLSSSRALRDLTNAAGGQYFASAVGEVNVVRAMKANNAVVGGEGNGGVIYPDLHYGRDSLVGIALFLSHLAQEKVSVSALRARYPHFEMSKNKIQLNENINVDQLLIKLADHYRHEQVSTIDGVKVDFANGWVHLRKSNTEPIIRVYSEAATADEANHLAAEVQRLALEMVG